MQGFHRCRRKVTCGIRGCCANSRKKHVFTDPRNDHSKLRCAVFFAAGHLDDLRGVCSSRRQRQAECVKPQTLKTATQCMVLGTVSATGVTSQLLNLSYLRTPKVSMATSSNAAAQKPLQSFPQLVLLWKLSHGTLPGLGKALPRPPLAASSTCRAVVGVPSTSPWGCGAGQASQLIS